MKKGALILVVVLGIVGLTAFTRQNSESNIEPELKVQSSPVISFNPISHLFDEKPELTFFFNYGSRFTEISKATIENAISITDIFQKDQVQDIVSYGKVSLILIKDESQSNIQEFSEGTVLTEAQKELLKSLDYSDNFNLRADCKRLNAETGEVENSFHSPHLTIVPDKQAKYIDGRAALLRFIKEGSMNEKEIAQDKTLRPAKLYFTVSKKGKITKVKIGNHSGFKALDDKLIELLNNLPGKWHAAENENGDKIDQELVLAYGFDGC